ncbi:hypothetical protein GPALN_004454 [Globodera pallida]|nr:hypothetical protein GPALN_004454 [Globodera pallida]
MYQPLNYPTIDSPHFNHDPHRNDNLYSPNLVQNGQSFGSHDSEFSPQQRERPSNFYFVPPNVNHPNPTRRAGRTPMGSETVDLQRTPQFERERERGSGVDPHGMPQGSWDGNEIRRNPDRHRYFDAEVPPNYQKVRNQLVDRYGNDDANKYLAYLVCLNQPITRSQNFVEKPNSQEKAYEFSRKERNEEGQEEEVNRHRAPHFQKEEQNRFLQYPDRSARYERSEENRNSFPQYDQIRPHKTNFSVFQSGAEIGKDPNPVNTVRMASFGVVPQANFEGMETVGHSISGKKKDTGETGKSEPQSEEASVDFVFTGREKHEAGIETVLTVPEKKILREHLETKIDRKTACTFENKEGSGTNGMASLPIPKSPPIPLNSIKFHRPPCRHPPIPLNLIKFPNHFQLYPNFSKTVGSTRPHQGNQVRKKPTKLGPKVKSTIYPSPRKKHHKFPNHSDQTGLKISIFLHQSVQNPKEFCRETVMLPTNPFYSGHYVPIPVPCPSSIQFQAGPNSAQLHHHLRRLAGARQGNGGGRRAALFTAQ